MGGISHQNMGGDHSSPSIWSINIELFLCSTNIYTIKSVLETTIRCDPSGPFGPFVGDGPFFKAASEIVWCMASRTTVVACVTHMSIYIYIYYLYIQYIICKDMWHIIIQYVYIYNYMYTYIYIHVVLYVIRMHVTTPCICAYVYAQDSSMFTNVGLVILRHLMLVLASPVLQWAGSVAAKTAGGLTVDRR